MMFEKENKESVPETRSAYTQSSSTFQADRPPVSQKLQVSYTNWANRHAEVADPDSSTVFYNIDFKNRKPNLSFKIADSEQPFATVSYHCLSTKIDIDLNGTSFEMKKPKAAWWSCTYNYTSPAMQNHKVRWTTRSRWKYCDYILEDENGQTIARYRAPSWSLKKMMILEFAEEQGELDDQIKQEVVVTATTLMYVVLASYSTAAVSVATTI